MAPIITSRARAGRDLCGIPVRLSLGQSRRVVGADQPGPDVERSVAHAAAQQQRDPVPDDHRAGGIAAPARPALCRHRRRQAARDAGRRQDLDRADRERADADAGTRASCRRSTPTARSTSRSAGAKTTTSGSTSTSPPISARRSRASPANIPAGSVNVIREDPANAERPVSGHGLRRLRVDRWRTAVAGARRRPAVGPGLGPGLPRSRPPDRDFDLRPRDVRARRAAAAG